MRISLSEPAADDAALLQAFQAGLIKRDLAPATVRVYLDNGNDSSNILTHL